ncbi:hypothetical protein G6F43_010508 [Rhizopus delemar]|nr:hypothetical protein G6F43_010508 [Rhizopus delemar]
MSTTMATCVQHHTSYPRLQLKTDTVIPTITMFDLFCSLVLHTLHFIYILYSLVVRFFSYWDDQSINNIKERIEWDQSRLTKIPKHLSIHVSSELTRDGVDWQAMVNNLCLISCWAYGFGVMKSMSVDVHKQHAKMLKEWISSCTEKTGVEPLDAKFSILSSENGKPNVASVLRRMIKQGVEEIDVKLVNQYVHEDTISDPDLMIVFGGLPHNYVSIEGYSPWHMKSTEFINYHQLNYVTFSKCLYRFSKLEQRFGR